MLQILPEFEKYLLNFDQFFSGFAQNRKIQHFCENCCIKFFKFLGIRHAESSKVQGTVKVQKFKKVRNFNSTLIPICNPAFAARLVASIFFLGCLLY